jgi:hypothetical protein
MIQVKIGAKIENPRAYECGAVEHLQQLLEAGSPVQLDSQRENFYEIESGNETYYIHLSPISGNVVLVAKWLRQPQTCCAGSGHLFA